MVHLVHPARLLITVYGPGPSCERLATLRRRGRAGLNRLPVSGTLFGRRLPPGRYAIVVEALRRGERVHIGRVLVTILAQDGREGGSRLLATPACEFRTDGSLTLSGGDGSALGLFVNASSGRAAAGGVAGVGTGDGGSLLPQLPVLPTIPSIPVADSFNLPPWTVPALAALIALGAFALIDRGFRRYRERSDGWD